MAVNGVKFFSFSSHPACKVREESSLWTCEITCRIFKLLELCNISGYQNHVAGHSGLLGYSKNTVGKYLSRVFIMVALDLQGRKTID